MFTSSRARPSSTELITQLALTVAILIALSLSSWGLGSSGPVSAGVANTTPSSPSVDGLVTHDLASGGETPASLVQALVGPGPVITNIQYSGAPIAAGSFSGGTGIIGFGQGIILSTGNVAGVIGPMNLYYDTTTENGTPGDPDLEVVVGPQGNGTWDASVLEFDLECPVGSAISFQYVFSSEEYDDTPAPVHDVFACFVNGQNIARIPGTNSPVEIQTVNCGVDYDPPSGVNCAFYRTNDCETIGSGFPCSSNIVTEMDGLTVVLSATGTLQPGLNHIKLAIADTVDMIADSNVFIRGQSFVCSPGTPVFEAPSSCNPILRGWAGAPLSFDVHAWAVTGLPGESVTLGVTGDTVPLAAGNFVPSLPTGPAQPVASRFQWTPTPADVGLYHLDFTATDQLQGSAVLNVPIQISMPDAPVFEAPSPCGQVLDAFAGAPFTFGITAAGWTSTECGINGGPGPSVTLSVTGDAAPLAGGTFVPPLPTGPSRPASTQFHWTPTLADVGLHQLDFTATDQVGQSVPCSVTIRVSSQRPVFQEPSPCNQVVDATAGLPFSFDVVAFATNGAPEQSVILNVTGDAIPLAGGTLVPPLPTGPAQPASTEFQWTPTAADVGLYHLDFTATDQLQQSTSCSVTIRVSVHAPVFESPSPCGQIVDAVAGLSFSFHVVASATNGAPEQSVTLSVTGDAIPLAGGTFVPPLPTGPAQPASTQFQWTPTPADVGLYHLDFAAVDQLQQSTSCGVTIRVTIHTPVFEWPSPCLQTVYAAPGVPLSFGIHASASNGAPGQSVTLSVTGDAIPLAGGTFVPPLPAGPAQPVSTQFQWTPTLADLGLYHLDFTATDQLLQSTSCDVTIRVLESPGIDLCQAGTGGVIPCPCGNPPATSPGGCDNSWGTGGARLASIGVPLVHPSTVVFTTTGETPTALSIVVQGNSSPPAGIVYGQGVRCFGGLLKRMYVKSASGGSITAPQPGDRSVPDRSQQLGDIILPGTNRYYAVYYRDTTILGGCPAYSTFNVTQTQRILWMQ